MKPDHIPLDEWRKEISPKLDLIQWEAGRTKHHAIMVQGKVLTLPVRPEWRSLAIDEIDKAIKATSKALEMLMDAKKAYEAKKVVT